MALSGRRAVTNQSVRALRCINVKRAALQLQDNGGETGKICARKGATDADTRYAGAAEREIGVEHRADCVRERQIVQSA
jgi:hypothetical protein